MRLARRWTTEADWQPFTRSVASRRRSPPAPGDHESGDRQASTTPFANAAVVFMATRGGNG